MSPAATQPKFTHTYGPDVPADLIALAAVDEDALDAAQAILADLAAGGVRGKLLGARNVSGDLTGAARVKFDVPGHRPQRFRLVYVETDARTRHVLAIGARDEHAIYRAAVRRLRP